MDEYEEEARKSAAMLEQAAERVGVSLMATADLFEAIEEWGISIAVDPPLARRFARLLEQDWMQRVSDLVWEWNSNRLGDKELAVKLTDLIPANLTLESRRRNGVADD